MIVKFFITNIVLLSWTFPLIQTEVAITKEDKSTTLWFNSSNTHVATFSFTYDDLTGRGYEQDTRKKAQGKDGTGYICVTDVYWGYNCDYWGSVGWNEGTDWGYKPGSAIERKDKNGKSLISRMTLYKTGSKYVLNIENPSKQDEGMYVFGLYWGGGYSGSRGKFYLKDMQNHPQKWNSTKVKANNTTSSQSGSNPLLPHISRLSGIIAISNPTYEDTMAVETGFSDVNLWLEWMRFTANQHNKSNCYVCGAARPHLGTVPLNLPEEVEECFLSLFTNTTTNKTDCQEWKDKYPILTKTPRPGEGMEIYPGNYTCYNGSENGKELGTLGPEYCARYSNITADKLQNMTQSIGDVFWICGDMKIRSRMTGQWKGECALAKAIMGLHIFEESKESGKSTAKEISRRKRELKGNFDPHVYLDAIGVPRGVPDEFKARDQVAAGFESMIPIITVNKNVDWINYIYYNQQRFVNYTRDALQGIAEQLMADSTMTFQNRMSLDMMLAEKGGVCVMLKLTGKCCTWIPDNVGPNGKTTVAIKKLTDLSEELKQNSGIDNPWDQYFGWFKGWKQALTQLGMVILIVLLCAGIIFCCVIPIIKRIAVKGVSEVTTMYQETKGTKDEYTTYLLKYKQKKRMSKNHIV